MPVIMIITKNTSNNTDNNKIKTVQQKSITLWTVQKRKYNKGICITTIWILILGILGEQLNIEGGFFFKDK